MKKQIIEMNHSIHLIRLGPNLIFFQNHKEKKKKKTLIKPLITVFLDHKQKY